MVGLGPTFAWTLAGRLLVGLYFGVVEGPARAYVGEVTGREVRGLIGNILNTVTPVCIVVVLGLGSRLPWRTIEFALETTAAVVQACGLLFLPRSPKWLLAHGHSREEAEESLRFFHGPEFDIKQGVRDIEGSLAHAHQPSSGVMRGLGLVFGRWENLHPTLLLLVQFFCMVFSGGLGVAQFAPTVFQLTGQDVNPFYSSVYVTAAMSLAFLLSGPLLERCSRVLLLQVAGLLGLAGCSAIGAYFWQATAEGSSGGQHAWLVLAGALATVLSYGAGIAPVSFTYLVELLPNSTRAITINMVLLYFSLVQFCAVHFFPAMERGLGNHGTFWLFAAVNALQVLLATFALPETRGLSLEEIQHKFFAARRRSSAGGQKGEQPIVNSSEDVERGQVNAAAELSDEDTAKEDTRRTGSQRSEPAPQTAEELERRRSSGSVLDAVYPAGCFV
ncbi:Facilitated trehalose transporter Tret1-2 [Amphibalanus amphitrite]|uniref:Facilitated trehalose transporter Tret1-2 n=1 Tax=Amphibalanus amphitrite TaxID=1232801 RepID=A0A6A4WFQ0_AMPAM|nr:Facilitated trehalose transporter Tret1-2 [Amphibalanus amphitrite]